MDTGLALHGFVTIFPNNFEFEVLVAFGGNCLLDLTDNLNSPALAFRVGDVHFADVFHEDGRLRATDPRPEFKVNFGHVVVGVRW